MTRPALGSRNIHASRLPNGLQVVTETMPHVRSVAVGVWVGTGARRETPELTGISHFLEHMVFQGTRDYSAEAIARSIDSIGGHLDAYTTKELVSFNTKVLDEHLPLAVDVLADLVLRPLLREADIEKEKGVILEEIKMETDSPEYLVHELFCRRFWPGHSLGAPILGTPETVRSFRREAIAGYHSSVYTASNLLVTAAGNVEHEQLLALVEPEFSALPAAPPPPPAEPATPQPHLHFEHKPSLEQVHLCLGVPSYPVNHERRYDCYVLNTILGAGMSSRLFQNIREKRGLAYSVGSELSLFRDTGCLLISAGTSPANVQEVVRLTLEELARLKDEPVGEEELERAKSHLKGSIMLSLESTSARMANLARQRLFFGRFFGLDEILAGIESVTAESLQAVARAFFSTPNLALTALGPLEGIRFSELTV